MVFVELKTAPGAVGPLEQRVHEILIDHNGHVAVIGFKTSLWIVAAALAGHGLFDSVHPWLIANPGVPAWWPGFCFAYDVAAGAILAGLLALERRKSIN